MDREPERHFYEASVLQFLLDKTFDHARHADADLGKINQKIHVRNIDGIGNGNVISLQVIIDILTCHIVLIKQHKR